MNSYVVEALAVRVLDFFLKLHGSVEKVVPICPSTVSPTTRPYDIQSLILKSKLNIEIFNRAEFYVFCGGLSQYTLGNLISSRDSFSSFFSLSGLHVFRKGASQHTLGNEVSSRDAPLLKFLGGEDGR